MPDEVQTADGNTIDIAGLMRRLNLNEAQVSASQADLNAGLAAARGAAGGAAGGAMLQAKGQIAVNTEQMKAAVQRQTDDAAAAAQVGMTPGAPSDLVVATINDYNANQADLLERGKMISAKQGQEFFDNPMQWLTNQFALPYDIAAYNLKLSEQDRNREFLSGLSKRFDDQARVNASVDVATGESLLQGMNNIALGKAQEAAAGSALAVAQLGISVANMRVAMTDKVFGNALQVHAAFGQEQDRSLRERDMTLRQAADARAEETQRLATETHNATMGEIERKEAGRAAIQDRLNKAAIMFNMTPPSVDEYLMDPNIQKSMKPFMTSTAVQSGFYGTNPAEALANVQSFTLTPAMEQTKQYLLGQVNTLITGKSTTWKSLGPEAQEEAKVTALREAAIRERNNIPVAPSPTSLYATPPLRSVFTMSGLLADDKKSYRFSLLNDLAPIVEANPTSNTDPNLFFDMAARRIQAGTATADQMAVEIAGIYQAIGADNSNLRGYNRFSLPVLAPTNGGFKQQVDAVGGSVIDLMNESAIRNAIDRLVVKQKVDLMRDPTTPQGRAALMPRGFTLPTGR